MISTESQIYVNAQVRATEGSETCVFLVREHYGTYDVFDVRHEVVKCNESKLCFKMGILAQVPGRVSWSVKVRRGIQSS